MRPYPLILLCGTLAGLAGVFFLSQRVRGAAATLQAAPQPATPEPSTPRPQVAQPADAMFTWASIESQDPRQLAENLRRIGCPEQTIRDILRARIRYAYQERIRNLWNPMARHWSQVEERKAHQKDVATLLAERDQIMADLGIPPQDGSPKPQATPPTKTSQLPPEKLKAIADINARYPNQLLPMDATPAEVEQTFKNRKARLDYLATQLTPEELKNYRLELDSNIKTVATLLRPLNPNPEELNKVAFALDFSEARIVNGHLPPQAEQVLKEGLSPERYAQYRTAFADENAPFTHFCISDNTPPDQIAQLNEIRKRNLEGAELRDAVSQVLSPQRASKFLMMTQRKH